MNKLISYLRSLIEAAFNKKKAFISSQAMVNNSWTDINDGDSTYVAAHDGYLKIGFATTDTNVPWVRADITNNLSINVPAVGSVGSQTCVYIPVKKGDNVQLSRNNCNLIQYQIFRLVGGGV